MLVVSTSLPVFVDYEDALASQLGNPDLTDIREDRGIFTAYSRWLGQRIEIGRRADAVPELAASQAGLGSSMRGLFTDAREGRDELITSREGAIPLPGLGLFDRLPRLGLPWWLWIVAAGGAVYLAIKGRRGR